MFSTPRHVCDAFVSNSVHNETNAAQVLFCLFFPRWGHLYQEAPSQKKSPKGFGLEINPATRLKAFSLKKPANTEATEQSQQVKAQWEAQVLLVFVCLLSITTSDSSMPVGCKMENTNLMKPFAGDGPCSFTRIGSVPSLALHGNCGKRALNVIAGCSRIGRFAPQPGRTRENLRIKPCSGRSGAPHMFFSMRWGGGSKDQTKNVIGRLLFLFFGAPAGPYPRSRAGKTALSRMRNKLDGMQSSKVVADGWN